MMAGWPDGKEEEVGGMEVVEVLPVLPVALVGGGDRGEGAKCSGDGAAVLLLLPLVELLLVTVDIRSLAVTMELEVEYGFD